MRWVLKILLLCVWAGVNPAHTWAQFPTAVMNVPASASCSYCTEACDYIADAEAAGASFTTPQKEGIDRWFRDAKGEANTTSWNGTDYTGYTTYNYLSRIKIFVPYLGGTAATVVIDFMGVSNATIVGSPTVSANGVALTGTSGAGNYINTNYVAPVTVTGIGYHRRNNLSDGGATMGASSSGAAYFQLLTGYQVAQVQSASPGISSSSSTVNVAALWVCYISGTTPLILYRDGTSFKSAAQSSVGNNPANSLFVGAYQNNSNAPVYPGTALDVDAHFAIDGTWTASEMTAFSKSWYALQNVFGR